MTESRRSSCAADKACIQQCKVQGTPNARNSIVISSGCKIVYHEFSKIYRIEHIFEFFQGQNLIIVEKIT